jgi:hypothetical protein
VLVTQTNGILGLVEDVLVAMGLVVFLTAGLVCKGLAS